MNPYRIAVVLAALFLSACGGFGGTREEPLKEIVYVPKEVIVPGPSVPCRIAPVEKPQFYLDDKEGYRKLPPFMRGSLAIGEIEQRRAYEHKLETAIKACQ